MQDKSVHLMQGVYQCAVLITQNFNKEQMSSD